MKKQCKYCHDLYTPSGLFILDGAMEFCSTLCKYKWNRDHKEKEEDLIDNVQ